MSCVHPKPYFTCLIKQYIPLLKNSELNDVKIAYYNDNRSK
jgi:hypothetical protein